MIFCKPSLTSFFDRYYLFKVLFDMLIDILLIAVDNMIEHWWYGINRSIKAINFCSVLPTASGSPNSRHCIMSVSGVTAGKPKVLYNLFRNVGIKFHFCNLLYQNGFCRRCSFLLWHRVHQQIIWFGLTRVWS